MGRSARKAREPGEAALVVAVVQADLLVPGCRSLKEKRSVIRGLVERARLKFNASVAEVGGNDLLQRAILGAAFATNDRTHAAAEAEALLDYFAGCPDVRVLDRQVEVL